MKNNLLTTILNWVLFMSLVLSIVFAIQFYFRTRELRIIQGEMNRYQNTRTVMNLLVNDIAEYSRRDTNIFPILETIGLKPVKAGSTAATTKSAAK